MENFFCLPKYITLVVFKDWLEVRDVGKWDTSLCNKIHRTKFLEDFLSVDIVYDGEAADCSCSLLLWLCERHISLKSLNLKCSHDLTCFLLSNDQLRSAPFFASVEHLSLCINSDTNIGACVGIVKKCVRLKGLAIKYESLGNSISDCSPQLASIISSPSALSMLKIINFKLSVTNLANFIRLNLCVESLKLISCEICGDRDTEQHSAINHLLHLHLENVSFRADNSYDSVVFLLSHFPSLVDFKLINCNKMDTVVRYKAGRKGLPTRYFENNTPLVGNESKITHLTIVNTGIYDVVQSFFTSHDRKAFECTIVNCSKTLTHVVLVDSDISDFEPTLGKSLFSAAIHVKKAYINSLYTSYTSAVIAEVPLLAVLPNYLIQTKLLNPMKLATSGTVLASKLALDHGWAVNLSGGYHHAKTDSGSGFCFFADIPLAIHELFTHHGDRVKKVLIVDLDAHQGNGFQAAFTVKNFNQQPPSTWASWLFSSPPQPDQLSYAADPRIDILDMYNGDIYPGDTFAKQFITYDLPLRSGTRKTEYLKLLRKNLSRALDTSRPDIVFYNAGTDIFEHDQLGSLGVSADGIADRDEEVFRSCAKRGVPVVMTLSGGYTQESASIIADSLLRLVDRKVLPLPERFRSTKRD